MGGSSTDEFRIKYHSSGAYEHDIQQVANRAMAYLGQRVKSNKVLSAPKKLAIVLDIDETSLSNYPDLKTLGFGGTPKMQDQAENRGDDSAIQPTLALYDYAVAHNVTVFFITGRVESARSSTLKNLINVGYTHVTGSGSACENGPASNQCSLYLRDKPYIGTSAIPYKTAMRKKIAEAGYDIVLNAGDQYSDLSGGYSEHIYKYPNYMYYIA